jgi:16S rRNA (uracil1498-N3)-methyltransferase
MLPRFFVPAVSSSDHLIDLPAGEADHLRRVLRLRRGDLVGVFDGRGHEFLAAVETADRDRVTVRTIEPRAPLPEPTVRMTLASALLKGDKLDHVVRDATMLGVAALQPLVTARTEVPLARAARSHRLDRWQRIAIASAKQCGRAVVPQIQVPAPFDAWLDAAARETPPEGGRRDLMFVEPGSGGSVGPGFSRADVGRTVAELGRDPAPAAATILIGPEGGWSPEECTAATGAGFTLLTLGPRILRADAAAAAILSVLQFVWKDM